MELASARALKEEAKLQVLGIWEEEATSSLLGVRAQSVKRVSRPRTIAVGLSWAAANDYRLAVRVQHPLLLRGKEVESLRQLAKGEIDVQYIGIVRKLAGPGIQTQVRPLQMGASVGHFQVTAGSIGAFVQDAAQTMILSNNHVLANENLAAPGDHILQPGTADNGTDPADAVATLTRFIPIDFVNHNLVDCAVGGLMGGIGFDSSSLGALGQLNGVRTTALGQDEPVAKLGRTTGPTRGTITAVELDNVTVEYGAGDAVFDQQIEIQAGEGEPFSLGGDSGSLIVDGNMQAVGLLFAGTDSGGVNNLGHTYANHIDEVFRAL